MEHVWNVFQRCRVIAAVADPPPISTSTDDTAVIINNMEDWLNKGFDFSDEEEEEDVTWCVTYVVECSHLLIIYWLFNIHLILLNIEIYQGSFHSADGDIVVSISYYFKKLTWFRNFVIPKWHLG